MKVADMANNARHIKSVKGKGAFRMIEFLLESIAVGFSNARNAFIHTLFL